MRAVLGNGPRRLAWACLCLLALAVSCDDRSTGEEPSFGMVVHGGAGTMTRDELSPEDERLYREALDGALRHGYEILHGGGTSLDAVESTLRILEDSPLFNAGKGAVFTHEGTNELDASIMDGSSLEAGAVAAVRRIRNPIGAARAVLERSPHVLLVGEGAEAFAADEGLALVDPEYFHTERRWRQLLERRGEAGEPVPGEEKRDPMAFGTVGAVALDRHGNLAAGTSTGGLTNKRYGRVGDSPIIGAGTYADNRSVAVSATGQGEYLIRSVAAKSIAAWMALGGMPVSRAADRVVLEELTDLGGLGGVIAIDAEGNVAMSFNTPGMYRGRVDRDGNVTVSVFRD